MKKSTEQQITGNSEVQ